MFVIIASRRERRGGGFGVDRVGIVGKSLKPEVRTSGRVKQARGIYEACAQE